MTGQKDSVKLNHKNRIECPFCRTATTQEVTPETRAVCLPVWCRKCKRTFEVNIDSGQCSLRSPS